MEVVKHHQNLQQIISFYEAESELYTIITGFHGYRGCLQFTKSKRKNNSKYKQPLDYSKLDLHTATPENVLLLHLTCTQQTFVWCLLGVPTMPQGDVETD